MFIGGQFEKHQFDLTNEVLHRLIMFRDFSNQIVFYALVTIVRVGGHYVLSLVVCLYFRPFVPSKKGL